MHWRRSNGPQPVRPRRLDVVGAGPAGLSAAITAARAGLEVVVHERARTVGSRFHGDFQGLENWTTERGVLDELDGLGIEPSFEHSALRALVVFGPDGTEGELRSGTPLCYLVRRGPDVGTLDTALLAQAREAGAEVRFDDPIHKLPQGGVVAHGPRASDAVAVGWTFRTDLADGAYGALGEEIAPRGYAYLLACGGRATLAVCLFADFHREDLYLERALDLFQRRVGFRMDDARRFAGAGAMRLPGSAVRGRNPFAGEAAGFQDPLWGFGMRYALLSGHLAARAWIEGAPEAYDALWRERLGGLMRAGAVNRFFFELCGDPGYRASIRASTRARDSRSWLRRRYAPSWLTTAVFPWVQSVVFRSLDPAECSEKHCDCTWCRCVRGMPRPRREGAPTVGGAGWMVERRPDDGSA